jgi:hypothetical protein
MITNQSSSNSIFKYALREAGAELALAVKAVAHRLDLRGRIPCALAGGVIVRGQGVREMFFGSAHELGLCLDPVTSATEPAQGALRLARRLL